jgi:23S rRNA pseudouridine1911/1915/1917 synthase
MAMPKVEVLLHDGPCLVACKPPGLPTQAPPGIESMETRLRSYLAERSDAPPAIYLGIPHRLDRPASGVMVFATRRRAAKKISKQFERRTIKKIYWALVQGRPIPSEGQWRDFLRKIYCQPQAEVVAPDHPDAREAVLNYRTLSVAGDYSWLEIELLTGRTHQVRVQAASRGHPVLGDAQYGSSVPFGPQFDDQRLRAIALHARSLEFDHPAGKLRVLVTAPTPEFWPKLG